MARYLALLAVLFPMVAHATVFSGPINVYEGRLVFGDGHHFIVGSWSGAMYNKSGWFYAYAHDPNYPDGDGTSNVIVADAGVVDPLTISDANQFNYSSTIIGQPFSNVAPFGVPEGNTVLFVGGGIYGFTSYYGAVVIEDFTMVPYEEAYGYPCVRNWPDYQPCVATPDDPFAGYVSHLSGTWYFQDDGTSDFTTGAVPEPSSELLVIAGLLGLGGWRRARA